MLPLLWNEGSIIEYIILFHDFCVNMYNTQLNRPNNHQLVGWYYQWEIKYFLRSTQDGHILECHRILGIVVRWNRVERKKVVEYYNEEREERWLFPKLESGHLDLDKQKKWKVVILNGTDEVHIQVVIFIIYNLKIYLNIKWLNTNDYCQFNLLFSLSWSISYLSSFHGVCVNKM